jgi:hypothetical protein
MKQMHDFSGVIENWSPDIGATQRLARSNRPRGKYRHRGYS